MLEPESSIELKQGAAAGCPLARFKLHTTKDFSDDSSDQGCSKYLNKRTGWWDASFLYGQDAKAEQRARTFQGGKLQLPGGALPIDNNGISALGDQHNTWLGVAVLQV